MNAGVETDCRLRLRLASATLTLARQAAMKAVKREYQRQGIKVSHIAHREIVAAANEYLPNHPELIAEAKETVLRWHVEGVFGKRGGIRNPVRRAN